MALDKLVDSTQLDACMTAEANAIRAKTGGSGQLTYDFANGKGFADEIASIQTGGGAKWTANVNVQQGVMIGASTKAIIVDIPANQSIYVLLRDPGGCLSSPFSGIYLFKEDGNNTTYKQYNAKPGTPIGFWVADKIVGASLYVTAAQAIATGVVEIEVGIL